MINNSEGSSWRLGPFDDPGWFDIRDHGKLSTKFVMLTIFRLDWTDVDPQQDGIFNRLHSITIGSQNRKSKIHIENIAQLIRGQLHITSRFCDHAGMIHRNTQPLAGEPYHYMHRWMTLCYTGSFAQSILTTCSVLRDHDSNEQYQCNQYDQRCAESEVELQPGVLDRVVCDDEIQHVPRDHVSVGGATMLSTRAFSLRQIWGCLGQTFDPTTTANAASIMQESWPEIIGGCRAWYCCDVSKRCAADTRYAQCGGRYQQNQNLGLDLPSPITNTDSFFST